MMTKDEIFETKVRPVAELMLKQAAKMPMPGMQEAYYKELQAVNWNLNEFNEIEIQDSEGFPVTDNHGWPETLKERISRTFEKYFDKSDLPQTLAELDSKLKDPNLKPADRVRYVNHWLTLHPDSEYFNEKSLQIGSHVPKY